MATIFVIWFLRISEIQPPRSTCPKIRWWDDSDGVALQFFLISHPTKLVVANKLETRLVVGQTSAFQSTNAVPWKALVMFDILSCSHHRRRKEKASMVRFFVSGKPLGCFITKHESSSTTRRTCVRTVWLAFFLNLWQRLMGLPLKSGKWLVAMGLHDQNSEFKTLQLSVLHFLQVQGASELLPSHHLFWVFEWWSGAVPEASPTFRANPKFMIDFFPVVSQVIIGEGSMPPCEQSQ